LTAVIIAITICFVIKSFKDSEAEKIFWGEKSKKFPFEIQRKILSKLVQIDAAQKAEDLLLPPGHRMHLLGAERKGQYSVSINMKYRICFRFYNNNVYDLEVVDYH